MKRILDALFLILVLVGHVAVAAPVSWTGFFISRADIHGSDNKIYDTGGRIYSDEGVASLLGMLFGHAEGDVYYLQAYDYARYTAKTVVATWILAYYGEVLGPETRDEAMLLELGNEQSGFIGGTVIDDPTDFYIAFTTSVSYIENGTTWYGWAHLSIDGDGDISILGQGINLEGGSVVVGETSPEPSTLLLLLVGMGGLGLRRRPPLAGFVVY